MTTGIPALRDWQKDAGELVRAAWRSSTSVKALIAACPGAGKTLFTAMLIRELLIEDEIHIAVVLTPTTNIQLLWVEVFKAVGVKATAEASNANLRWRKEAGVSMTEDNQVLVLTYAQLARDSELIAEMARRAGFTLVIGDEIHHADDDATYGAAVQTLADACMLTLALSGTPFNSEGGSIALCECEIDVDAETGKPIRRTIATFTYSYAEAIDEGVCRPVEFIKVYGRGEATYRLLSNDEIFKRITDLARQRKADKISILLDPEGEFMEECARQAVRALAELHAAGDKKAAMLVVAKNKEHGAQMTRLLIRMCEAESQPFLVQEIYNDTPKAHKRIEDLSTDSTDIVVSVRMISEGVDIKRLRIGLFATDWMTRIFFIQFVGRFVRYEDRLDKTQFARVIIPAHVVLLKYAREIEKMIEAAAIVEVGDGNGGGENKSEFVEATTEAGTKGLVYRSEELETVGLAEAFFQASPSARGFIPGVLAIKIAEELGLGGAIPNKGSEQKIDWGNRNDLLVRAVVKRLKNNGGQSDDDLYAKVQARANQAVGIAKKDKLTAEDTLIRRHAYLQTWLKRLVLGQDDAA